MATMGTSQSEGQMLTVEVDEEPLRFSQDTRTPRNTGHKAFIDIGEERFQWQKPVSDFDAYYDLPGTLTRLAPVFGSSTRADWEGTYKNKRDGINPYAGPGNYNTNNFGVLSTCNNPAKMKFGFSSRNQFAPKNSTGPCYDIDGIWRNGRDRTVGMGFNKDHRRPMLIPSTDASYFPNVPKGTSVKIAGKLKTGSNLDGGGGRSPGPIYNTAKYDFRTGPKFSFGANKTDRFKHSGLGF